MAAVSLFWTRFQREGFASFHPRHGKLLERVFAEYHTVFPSVDFATAGHVLLFRLGFGAPLEHATLRRPAVVREVVKS